MMYIENMISIPFQKITFGTTFMSGGNENIHVHGEPSCSEYALCLSSSIPFRY